MTQSITNQFHYYMISAVRDIKLIKVEILLYLNKSMIYLISK